MAKATHYNVIVKCANCGYEPPYSRHPRSLWWVEIPKGVSVSRFLQNKKCSCCGTKGNWKARGT